jgi:ribosome-associated protein
MIVDAARERKAFDLVLMDVTHLSSVTDYFFICSCRSSRQVQAVADHILHQMKTQGGFLPLGVEGKIQGHWLLLDFGEVIAHIFYEPQRQFYDLEGLWIEAERLDLEMQADSGR